MPKVFLGTTIQNARQLWWRIYSGEPTTVYTALSTTGGRVYNSWTSVWTNNNSHYQLGANEYPTGISFSGDFTNAGNDLGANIYLCDSNGENEILLGWMTVRGCERDNLLGPDVQHYTYYQTSASILDKNKADIPLEKWKALKGKVLCLKRVGGGNIIPDAQLTVTITTEIDEYNITVNQTTGGTASASQSQATAGTAIRLNATPATGYQLSGWDTNPALTITNNQFTMPWSHVTITPRWAKINYNITKQTNIAGAGTVTAANTGQMGDTISVSQTANEGYAFDHWELSDGEQVTNGSFTMPAGDVTVTAVYTRNRYAITTETFPEGAGTVIAPETGQTGLDIFLSQTPAAGYTFQRWELSTGGTVTDNQFRMPAQAVTVRAIYVRIVYLIKAVCSPKTGGVITCTRASEYGREITVSQRTNEGYIFSGWTLSSGGEVTDGKFAMPDENVILTAHYTRDSAVEPEAETLMTFDLARILPRFILQDRTGYAMAKAIEAGLKDFLVICREGLDTWSDPDKMPEWRLDELAWEYGIPYDYDADEDIKRKWIREVYPLSRLYGTAEGIARYMDAYMRDTTLEENWEYGGNPFHFRVNFQGGWTPENIAWANKAIETVKNARSLLDSYHYRAGWTQTLREGTAFHGSASMEATIRKGNTAELDCYADEDGDMLLDENGHPMLAE